MLVTWYLYHCWVAELLTMCWCVLKLVKAYWWIQLWVWFLYSIPVYLLLLHSVICEALFYPVNYLGWTAYAVMIPLLALLELEGCQPLLGTLALLWTHLGDATNAWIDGFVVEVTLAVIICYFWVAPLSVACCGLIDACLLIPFLGFPVAFDVENQ
jgi:hypothetical protein